MTIQAVLFDAVGTLIYADPPVAAVYRAGGLRHGIDLSEDVIRVRFGEAFAAEEAADTRFPSPRIDHERERQRWRRIVSAVFPELGDTEQLFSELWDYFAQPASWRLFDDVRECWDRLSASGVIPGIASNFDERLLRICRGLPPLDHCQQVFGSSQIGYRKPAPEFFRAIEASLALPADRILLVGDDWDGDYQGALAAGWQSVLLDRDGSHSHLDAASIGSLAELVV